MATLRAGTPLGACFPCSEMLTSIDQPPNKLEDLRLDEMRVYPPDVYACSDVCSSAET